MQMEDNMFFILPNKVPFTDHTSNINVDETEQTVGHHFASQMC